MSSSPRSSSPSNPSSTTKNADRVEREAQDALQENLDDYEAIASYSGTEFTTSRVNEYNQKYARLQDAKKREQDLLRANAAADKILQKIEDLETLTSIQDIMTELDQNSDNLDDAFYVEMSKLLTLPMITVKLKAWIQRKSESEQNERNDKIRKMKGAIAGLKINERQRALDRAEKEAGELQDMVTELDSQLKVSEKSNNDLNNKISDLKLELGQRSSATNEEVSGLRFKLGMVENDKNVALEKIEERRKAQVKAEKELEELKQSIQNKDEIIKKKELDIDEARAQTTRQVEMFDKLKEKRFTEQGEQTATSHRLQLEQQSNENLTKRNKELHDMYDQTRDELRKLSIDSRVEIDALKVEKNALEQDKNSQVAQVIQLQKDLTAHKTLLADSQAKLKKVTEQKQTLAQDYETARAQALNELEYTRFSLREDISKLQTQLEKEMESVTDLDDQVQTLKVQHQDELQDMKDQLTETTNTLDEERVTRDRLSTLLRNEEAETERFKIDNTAQQGRIERLSAQVAELQDLVAQHEEAEPDMQEKISLLETHLQRREVLVRRLEKQVSEKEQDLDAVNQILVSYTFHGDVKLNYRETKRELSSTPKVSRDTVHQALTHIEPTITNIEVTHCLTGFQIWVEATIKSTSFTLSRIIAYLQGPGDFDDIGFLWLATRAVIESADAPETILAIYNVMHLWMRLDPERRDSIRQLNDKVTEKVPAIWFTKERKNYWFYISTMQDFIKDLLDYHMPSLKTIGRYMTLNTLRRKEYCLTLAEDKHIIHLNPLYIYVHNERVVWLHPGQITFEIDLPNACFYIHDNLTPHQIDRHPIPFVDMERVCNIIEDADVTYIE